jgi:hypothetical protein
MLPNQDALTVCPVGDLNTIIHYKIPDPIGLQVRGF